MEYLNQREIILFQGDSVTDCGRDYGNPLSLGTGYPLLVSSLLSARYIEHNLTFVNRGVSGNRVRDLEARWDADCIALKPTVVSILIGINDTWRRYDSNDATGADAFEQKYRRILSRVKEETSARIIILEPFVLPINKERESWREDLDPKIGIARKLAREYHARYIPLDGLFAAACSRKPAEFWAEDGVHPSVAGHGLIAEAWMEAAKQLFR